MSYVVGLTGGAGSGKSTVAEVLERCGAAVVDTDAISHQLTQAGGAAMPEITAVFGTELLDELGGLHRARMRDLAFRDTEARTRLEAILHPLIHRASLEAVAGKAEEIVVLVVPLLFERMTYRAALGRVVCVDCSVATQIERVSRRPGVGTDQASAIVRSQLPRPLRLQLADDVIHNEGGIAALSAAAVALYARLRQAKL